MLKCKLEILDKDCDESYVPDDNCLIVWLPALPRRGDWIMLPSDFETEKFGDVIVTNVYIKAVFEENDSEIDAIISVA